METLQKALLVAIAVILFTICYPLALRFYHWLFGGDSPQNGHHRSTSNNKMERGYFTRRHLPDDQTFSIFTDLGEDLMTHVLSFVAEAPFEQLQNTNSEHSFMAALTHSLPLVSKQFYRLTKTDDLWKAAIIRQVSREETGGLWDAGLKSLLLHTNNNNNNPNTTESVAQLLDRICESSDGTTTCAEIYRTILNNSVRVSGPIFCMPQRLKLGVPYGLHFFEPRYRRMMADIMAPFPETARQGGPISEITDQQGQQQQSPPVFIHAHAHGQRLERGTPACLVQVIRCHIYPDGRADVFLMPTCHVRTELLWEVPNTGYLYFGQFMRLGRAASEQADREASAAARRPFGQY